MTVVISPEPLNGFSNFKSGSKLKRFGKTCIYRTDLKILSVNFTFSLNFSVILIFNRVKSVLKLHFEILFIGYQSLTLYHKV